jgi:Na+-transporting NADH:ubiquinone oxidoreductase subunit A
VSGTVKEIVRGEKRKLLAILIESDGERKCVDFGVKDAATLEAGQIRQALLESGLWPWLVQRPYGILANPDVRPRDIFVSTFSTAPLAADAAFCFGSELAAAQAGICALSKLTDGKVYVGLDGNGQSPFANLKHCELNYFRGQHPAGNVGVQISHIAPIRKEETVWTVSMAGLVAIGKLFTTGKYDVRRKVAVTGPMAIQPSYVDALPGLPMKELAAFFGNTPAEQLRVISGDALSGKTVGADGYLGFFDNQVTILREGTEPELLGWINPIRAHQFSADRSYFSWLMPKSKKYAMDTNLHGGARAFLMNDGYYGRVLPMDIFPVFLAKACLAGDIEKMEKFGIYEVLPEDLATCEFVDPSKNNIQAMIEQGIDLMLKEMA